MTEKIIFIYQVVISNSTDGNEYYSTKKRTSWRTCDKAGAPVFTIIVKKTL